MLAIYAIRFDSFVIVLVALCIIFLAAKILIVLISNALVSLTNLDYNACCAAVVGALDAYLCLSFQTVTSCIV